MVPLSTFFFRGNYMKPYRTIFKEDVARSILPIGKFNLSTGSSKYFNVYEEWEDSTAEVWKDKSYGTIRFIFTSGDKPLFKIGSTASFEHDQKGKFLFQAELIDFAEVKDIKSKLLKYGKIVIAYTYK